MDYYYALLDNYKLLRQRKFKLSLREEEGEGASEEDNIAAVIGAAGADIDNPGDLNGVSLYKSDTGSIMASDREKGSTGQEQWAPVVDKDGKKGKSPSANKYWGLMFPAEDKEEKPPSDTEDEGGEGEEGQEVEVPGAAEVQAINSTLSEIDQQEAQRKLASGEEDEEEDEEDLVQKEKDTQREAEKLERLPQTTLDHTEFDPETVAKTLEGTNALLVLGSEMANNPQGVLDGEYTLDINELIVKHDATVDQYGCIRFGGAAIGVCDSESQVVSTLQEYLTLVQTAQESDREEKGIGSEARIIPEKPLNKYPVANEDIRGVAVENLDAYSGILSDCIENPTDECMDQLGSNVVDTWESGKTAIDPLLRSLSVGLLAQDSAILTGPEEVRAVETVKWLEARLIAEGATPENAKKFIEMAAGIVHLVDEEGNETGEIHVGEPDRIKAILALSLGNRHFAKAIRGDVPPDATIGAGQGQLGPSAELGNKQDLLDIFCKKGDGKEQKEKLREHVKGLLSESQKEKYSSKCGKAAASPEEAESNMNDYIDNNVIQEFDSDKLGELGSPCGGDGGSAFGISREPKTHSAADGKSVNESTLGQIGGDKVEMIFDHICGKGGDKKLKPDEAAHVDNVKKQISECGPKAKKGQASLGDTTFAGACAFQAALEKRQKDVLATLDPKNTTAAGRNARAATLKVWEENTSTPEAKRKKRLEGALRALNGTSTPETAEADAIHLGKIRMNVKGAAFREQLEESDDRASDGTLSGDSRSYMVTIYTLGSMARGEVINEKRNYSDNTHYAGLRNAEALNNVHSAVFKHGTGKEVSVLDENGEKRASLVQEGKGYKVKTGNSDTLYNQIADVDTAEEIRTRRKSSSKVSAKKKAATKKDRAAKKKAAKKKAAKKNNEMFVEYLKGQQRLLEVLLNRAK